MPKRWTEVNDRKLMLLVIGNPSYDYTAMAAHFDGPAGVPASAKAIEERLAKLKREGRAIAAENGASGITTTTATSSTAPAKKTKKGVAVVKKDTGTKRKAYLKEGNSEEGDDEELDFGETDEEDMPPAKKPKSSKNVDKDKPSTKKVKVPGTNKAIPTGPKRVTLSDDEGNEANVENNNVGEMEVDSSSEETDKVKDEET